MVRDKVTHLFLGADVAFNATGMANVDAGEIIVIDGGGSILNAAGITALGAKDPFYIVEGKRGNNVSHIISPKLTKNNIVNHRGTSYAAATQQVTYIGDNSNAGSINVLDSTEYSLSVSFEWDKDVYSERRDSKTYHYTSDASATDTEIATAFVNQMNADAGFSKQAVASVETGGGNVGIKIVGVAQAESDYDNPVIVSFSVALDKGFTTATQIDERGYIYVNGAAGTTTSAQSVAPYQGVGTSAIIKAVERNNDGFQNGVTNNRKFPVVKPDSRISATGTYDVYVIDYKDEHVSGEIGLGATRTTQGQIIVANDISTTVNGTTAALEALFAAITGVTVNL